MVSKYAGINFLCILKKKTCESFLIPYQKKNHFQIVDGLKFESQKFEEKILEYLPWSWGRERLVNKTYKP